jgi:hypothetical protein
MSSDDSQNCGESKAPPVNFVVKKGSKILATVSSSIHSPCPEPPGKRRYRGRGSASEPLFVLSSSKEVCRVLTMTCLDRRRTTPLR